MGCSEAQGKGYDDSRFLSLLLPTGFSPVTMPDASLQTRRERLSDYAAPAMGLRTEARTPMRRTQVLVDPPLIGPLLLAASVHGLIFWLVTMTDAGKHGTMNGAEQPQVEMVFDAPPVKHSMQGPPTHEVGGAASAPPPSSQEEATPAPMEPVPHAPSSPSLTTSPTGELTSAESAQHPLSKAAPRLPRHNRATPSHHPVTRQSDANPFARPMNLSLDGEPTPQPRRRGRRGGTGGPVDFSLGPLSMNGEINAPYKTRSSVKGVSSDYGSEVDRWIRNHMFYPDEAAQNGEEGPSSVHVVIDRSGKVIRVRLTDSSNSYSLDAATAGMFQGAQLPPVPPDMQGDHFDLDVTINYILIRH
ncbi:energy transducer TonB [Bombella saccharophila]|uniref:TonB family protein n=1 Tax=Bombella saccharophila TaxID=2967338 RepID=A0ABT3W6Z7_9PROT|nr:TonB family protein [Bombella saccharophila]MCX5614558.1 TonB family protein [Bombella saccharophila]